MNLSKIASQNFNSSDYTILIVDDNPTNLGVIADYLETYGFEIMIARDGEDALEKAQLLPPDLILLDVIMPGMDGFTTCQHLKAKEATQDIPVIFMTALVETENKVKGFEMGAVDYVTKPLHQEEVLARVMTHLRLRNVALDWQQKSEQEAARSQVERTRLFEAVNQQREQLQALARRLAEAQEAERTRLARELHDEMGQSLTGISINLGTVLQELADDLPASARERLIEAKSLTDKTLEQIRELSLELRPSMLDYFGLVATLRWYIKQYTKRTNIKAELEEIGFEERLPAEVETTLYRIIQEALTNVARHAQADRVDLRLRRNRSTLTISIEDNGRGFNLAEIGRRKTAAGLLGIQERVALVGGALEIETEPDRGTRLLIEIPGEETV